MKRILCILITAVCLALIYQANIWAGCENLDAAAVDVAFDKEVKAEKGFVYLSLIGGRTPEPNDCGLNPSNDPGEWMGWGGPLNFDNASIGEGGGTRNFITIGGIRYERGIGTHGTAKLVYDLTGGKYATFMCVAGMDDEKGDDGCGHGGSAQFVFSVDGTQKADTGILKGSDPEGKEVVFDIAAGAKELVIEILDGGDGIGCDHADLGAPRLLPEGGAVSPQGRLTTTWASIKSSR